MRTIKRGKAFFVYREKSLIHDVRGDFFVAAGVLISGQSFRPIHARFCAKSWAPADLVLNPPGFRKWIEAGITVAEKIAAVDVDKKSYDLPLVAIRKGQLSEPIRLVWEKYPQWITPDFAKKHRGILPSEAAADSLRSSWSKASARLVNKHIRELGLPSLK